MTSNVQTLIKKTNKQKKQPVPSAAYPSSGCDRVKCFQNGMFSITSQTEDISSWSVYEERSAFQSAVGGEERECAPCCPADFLQLVPCLYPFFKFMNGLNSQMDSLLHLQCLEGLLGRVHRHMLMFDNIDKLCCTNQLL